MNRCVIFAANPVSISMREYCKDGDYVIAVDAGYENARRLCVSPSLYVGDFDTAPAPKTEKEIIKLKKEKDETDTFCAAKIAVERGFKQVIILGGMGGRFDHTLANMAVLVYLAQNKVSAILADEDNEVSVLLFGEIEIAPREDWYISVFPITDKASGVTLERLKYVLNNAVVTNSFPIGVSNEFRFVPAKIKVVSGGLYIVQSRKE